MKSFRKIILFAFLLTIIAFLPSSFVNADEGGGGGGEATPTPAPTPEATIPASAATVDYANEEVKVTYDKQVYYAIVKKADDTTVKANALIEAARDGSTNNHIIDFSTIAITKDCYIGLAATNIGDASGNVKVEKVKIGGAPKKVAISVNWAMEGSSAQGYGLLSKVTVTDVLGKTVEYKKAVTTPSETEKELNEANIEIQWRKGLYGNWNDLATLTNVKWKSMCASGAMVYFRLKPTTTARASKEIKAKIASSKAPSLKIDVNKLSLPIKNGMEYRKAGDTEWTTILPFNNKSTTVNPKVSGANVFDPNTMNTSTKVTETFINDIMGSASLVAANEEQAKDTSYALTLEVRSAANAKKPASISTTVTIPYQMPAPTCTLTAKAGATTTYDITGLAVNTLDKSEGSGFEFFLITEEDIEKVDFAKVKWTAIKSNSKLTAKTASTVAMKDGTKKEYKMGDKNVIMLLRRKGVMGSAKKKTLLASAYAKITIPEAAAATPTPTPEATATPTPVPTP